jgi:TonB family protein
MSKSASKKKPSANKQSPIEQNVSAKSDSEDGQKLVGTAGAVKESEFTSYGRMLHDRFYSDWIQPKTSVAAGAKMSTLVRIRIEKDGRISKFTIVKPSGNVVLDESVAEIAKRVTQIDPLPNGFAAGPYYEVNINFELNPAE